MSVCLKAILFVFLTLTKAHAFVVGQSCGQLFDQTGDVIAYIADLSQNQKLSVEQMSRLFEALKNEDKFINPYTEQDAIASDAFIHWQKFEELIRDGAIDKKKLSEWLKEKLKEKEQVKVERDQVKQETQDAFVKIKFNPIKRGSFMMGEPGQQVLKKIDYDFEMMAYPVTQKQYAVVMKQNPSEFVAGPHTLTLEIGGREVVMQPDNPVEKVSVEDANKYFEFVNELSRKNDPLIYEIFPDHIKGAKYRLPTEAEWEYVARNEGAEKGEYSIDPQRLLEHGWFFENSDNTTHPVGEKLPQIINDNEFEMFGNVAEWTSTSVVLEQKLQHVICGRSWWEDAKNAHPSRNGEAPASQRTEYVGFRAVRILK